MTTRKSFRRYTLAEYRSVLDNFVSKVHFNEVHVHGTWKPTIADYRKAANKESLIQAMWRYHTETRKWSDIAQHATLDPDGYIWEGRSLLVPPASATGHNDPDDDGAHPFMFEMIGNFDKGAEALEGPQLATALALCRDILQRWHLPPSAVRFHREMTTDKTCPGSGVDKAAFMAQVQTALTAGDANVIIRTYLQPAWQKAKTREQKDEIHRLANELRKAANLPFEP